MGLVNWQTGQKKEMKARPSAFLRFSLASLPVDRLAGLPSAGTCGTLPAAS